MTEPQRFKGTSTTVEAMALAGYTEGLGPAPWNDMKGGCVWQWLTEHDARFYMDQQDPGPAYMRISTPDEIQRVDIGDWIVRESLGVFRSYKRADFAARFEPVPADKEIDEQMKAALDCHNFEEAGRLRAIQREMETV